MRAGEAAATDVASAWRGAAQAFVDGDRGRSIAVAGGGSSVAVAADVVRPAASLLKLPLAYAVMAAADAGDLDPEGRHAVAAMPDSAWPSILDAFDPDRAFRPVELCALMLATSDNRLAEHLLSLVGVDAVAAVLDRLGCEQTRLEVGYGDDCLDEEGFRNVTTATDALRLLRPLRDDPRLARLRAALEAGRSTARLRALLPPDTFAANKSGTLAGVVNDIGLVRTRRGDLAMAFLSEGQVDRPGTGLDIARCAAHVHAAFVDSTS